MIGYVALLRGINVGGKNIIKMTDLKACVKSLGLENVETYIQSGNVLFHTGEADQARLESRLERGSLTAFRYDFTCRGAFGWAQTKTTITQAPPGFGSEPDTYCYDVISLKQPLTSSEAMKSITTKEGVDQAFGGEEVLYFSRLASRASQSRLARIMGMPIYQSMTIRNWNTTTKLARLWRRPDICKILKEQFAALKARPPRWMWAILLINPSSTHEYGQIGFEVCDGNVLVCQVQTSSVGCGEGDRINTGLGIGMGGGLTLGDASIAKIPAEGDPCPKVAEDIKVTG